MLCGASTRVRCLGTDIVSTLRRLITSLPANAIPQTLSRLHVIDCPPALSNTKPAINNSLLSLLKQTLGIEVTHRRAAYDELLKASAIIDAYSTANCRIDFLSPRQPIDHRRIAIEQRMKWATFAALVLLLGYTLALLNTRRLSGRLASLQAQHAAQEKAIEQKQVAWNRAAAVDRWQSEQLNYSEAVADYLRELPDTQEIVLTRLELSRASEGANYIEIEGHARQSECVNRLIDAMAVSDRYARPQLKRLENKPSDARYGADFALSVELRGEPHVQH